jgi:hypothetical protein
MAVRETLIHVVPGARARREAMLKQARARARAEAAKVNANAKATDKAGP